MTKNMCILLHSLAPFLTARRRCGPFFFVLWVSKMESKYTKRVKFILKCLENEQMSRLHHKPKESSLFTKMKSVVISLKIIVPRILLANLKLINNQNKSKEHYALNMEHHSKNIQIIASAFGVGYLCREKAKNPRISSMQS